MEKLFVDDIFLTVNLKRNLKSASPNVQKGVFRGTGELSNEFSDVLKHHEDVFINSVIRYGMVT